HFFFKAGALVTSNYLKRQHGFSYMAYAGSLGADQLVLLFAAAVLGFGVASGLSPGHPELRILAGLYFLGAAVLFAFMRGIFSPQSREHSFWDPLIRAVQALAAILQNRNLFWTLLAYNLGLIGSTALRFFVACTILKLDVPLTYCFLITTIILLVSVVPLFQSDVGARELAVGLFAQSVGLGFDEGLLATVVDRGFVLLVTGLVAAGFRNLLVSTRGPSSPPP
ncbi:MAG: hypothetical protein GWM98_10710, partial [Nitrospinaceae bacterium]|nr:hypothetical protein [Nitrospinaceae bacterium]NIR54874.1 hypothetical protein [Nitrospinaceae bacterium]NIS85299.1 hypothetical protein [Nitrospinaceae bacterium]NIT82112.1 hypothetical protein [Nitrospinaceae bacterium]NIU44373.1 hypothetical protein [Nitrospinaceae bacterium]